MTAIDKLMVPSADGSGTEQIYPQTHPDAVVGLKEFLKDYTGSGQGVIHTILITTLLLKT